MKSIDAIVKGALLVLVAVAVTSCGLYGKYHSANTEEVENIEVPSYSDIFCEPELLSLIDTALACNYDLKIAHQHVRQADEQVTAARLAYLPRIFLGDNAAATFNSTANGISINQPSTWAYTFASASWELDIFGKVTNQKRMAQVSRQQAADFEQAARVELISAVATLYYELQVLDAQIDVADSAEVNWKQSVETMRHLKQAGANDEAAVAQFEGSYYATRQKVKSLRLMRINAENALRLLLCKDGGDIRRAPLMMNSPSLQVEGARIKSIDLRALRVRPDVKAEEMNLAYSFYDVNYARACCCPSISISGSIGWAAGGLIYNAVGGLLQPLLNAGQNRARLRVNKSRLEEAQMRYANVLLKAGTEVNDALAAIDSYTDQVDDSFNRVNSMKRALDATQLKMLLGRGTYLEVLTAQNDLLSSQIYSIENIGDILRSYVELYQALGGGKN